MQRQLQLLADLHSPDGRHQSGLHIIGPRTVEHIPLLLERQSVFVPHGIEMGQHQNLFLLLTQSEAHMVAPLFLGVDRAIDAHPLFHQLPDLPAAGIGQLLAGSGGLCLGQLHQIPYDLLPVCFHIFLDTLSLLVHKKVPPFPFLFHCKPLSPKRQDF